MSRSFHTTRRDLENMERWDYSDTDKRIDEIQSLKKQLRAKRLSKHHIRQERQTPTPLPPTCIESIPIEEVRCSDYLHFPADGQDMRNLLKMLPGGLVDGLAGVRLSLGKDEMSDSSGHVDGDQGDPYLGRESIELFNGVYGPILRGTYHPATAQVDMFGYVYEPNRSDRAVWEPYLRLQMLSTFVHEIGHHYDFTSRTARGRWRHDDKEKDEIYAETMQHKWLDECVIPYLQQTHYDEYENLQNWVMRQTGVRTPLRLMAGEPRSTARNGMILTMSLFQTSEAFEELFEDVSKGVDRDKVQLNFARNLHYSEEFTLALEVLDALLRDNANDLEAMAVRADILCHMERYEEALAWATRTLELDHQCVEALIVAGDVYEQMKDWPRLVETTEAIIAMNPVFKSLEHMHALAQRTLAKIELGQYDGVEEAIAMLMKGMLISRWRADQLRARLEELQ